LLSTNAEYVEYAEYAALLCDPRAEPGPDAAAPTEASAGG